MRARLLAIISLALAGTAGCATHTAAARPAGEAAAERVISQHAALRLVTDSLARVRRTADSLAVAWGGYVGDAQVGEKALRMSLRVPADSLNHGLDRLSALGRATRRTVRREDVTEQTVDVQARLETLHAVRERIRGYLRTAGGMADVVQLERELGRVQGEIDLLEARQRTLATQTQLAEIVVDAERPRILGPLGWIVVGVGTVIEKLFVIR
jgi:hypothetical protein